jgi:hypothetical protein
VNDLQTVVTSKSGDNLGIMRDDVLFMFISGERVVGVPDDCLFGDRVGIAEFARFVGVPAAFGVFVHLIMFNHSPKNRS